MPACASPHASSVSNPIGKIVLEDVQEELTIGKRIMGLPNASDYFALPTESCIPAVPIADPDIGSCDILKNMEPTETVAMLIMPNAGKHLSKYSANLSEVSRNFKQMFIHLLEGAILYQNAGYVHNDIHLGNVLVDANGVARYIDFGLAFRPMDITAFPFNKKFKPQYVFQAPEVHLWRMLYSKKSVADGVKDLRRENFEYADLEDQFPSRKNAVSALTHLLSTSKSFRAMDSVSFIRIYAKLFDSWRLGLCMWMLWQKLLAWPPFMLSSLYLQDYTLIRTVLGGMTDFDPRTRFSIEKALRTLDPNNPFTVTA